MRTLVGTRSIAYRSDRPYAPSSGDYTGNGVDDGALQVPPEDDVPGYLPIIEGFEIPWNDPTWW